MRREVYVNWRLSLLRADNEDASGWAVVARAILPRQAQVPETNRAVRPPWRSLLDAWRQSERPEPADRDLLNIPQKQSPFDLRRGCAFRTAVLTAQTGESEKCKVNTV